MRGLITGRDIAVRVHDCPVLGAGHLHAVSADHAESMAHQVILMNEYVTLTEQLVTEIVVRDVRRSTEFYLGLGFSLHRDGGDFVELTWEDHLLFLAEVSAFPKIAEVAPPARPRLPIANVRVMVSNVDEVWTLANKLGAPIVLPIGDRYYGLRDFMLADPDGFGVRFASKLAYRQ
ncbi:MAG TPA: VOC family protein [Anaeromyxobacteraceae bacterium]|nr:VOC family protein [Anaeromyxobacteraceae bacterium]